MSQTVMAGTNVTFEVTATGSAPLTYYWYKDSSYLGETGSSLTLTNVQWDDAGDYLVYVVDPNYWYTASDPAVLVVLQAPAIVSQPQSQTVLAGSNPTFSVVAHGGPTPAYQWQFNGGDIPGATQTNLTLQNVQATNAGTYNVTLSNYLGAVVSDSATLAVDDTQPILNGDLANRVAIGGTSVILSPSIYGTEPLAYQWRMNGAPLSGATNASLIFPTVQATNAGRYSLAVTNVLGSLTTRTATLTVEQYPAPSSTIVAWGDNTYCQTVLPVGETNVVALTAGTYQTVFLRADGTMGDFGSPINTPATYQGLPRVAAVETKAEYVLALGTNGTPFSFGLTFLSGASDVPTNVVNVVQTAISTPRLALLEDGALTGWIDASCGVVSQHDPGHILTALTNLSNVTAIAMSADYGVADQGSRCLALLSNHTVAVIGTSQAGDSTVVPNLRNVAAISAGTLFSLALKTDGTVVAWGDNTYGETNVPPGLSNVMSIAAGELHSLALTSNGMVVAWGDNTYGQCTVPASLSNVTFITAGCRHSAALTKQPGVSIPPTNSSVFAGACATFAVVATGYGPLNCQWLCNGTNLPGATAPTLVLSNVPLSAAGTYECLLSNSFGACLSPPATLTVQRTTPYFDLPPAGSLLTNGGCLLCMGGLSGHGAVILYASTNLQQWLPILTNPPTLGALQYFDSTISNANMRFYRFVEQ